MASYEKLEMLRNCLSELKSKSYYLMGSERNIPTRSVPIYDPMHPGAVIDVIDSIDTNGLKNIIREQNETIILLQRTLEILLDGIV